MNYKLKWAKNHMMLLGNPDMVADRGCVFECLGSSEQELTERMNAVLQEKAENQQSLVFLRKEHEQFRRQAEVILH